MALSTENLIATLFFDLDRSSLKRTIDAKNELSEDVEIKAGVEVDKGKLDQANKRIGGFSKGLLNLGKVAAGLGLAEILRQAATAGVDLAAGLETTTEKFAVFLGSTQAAESLLQEISDISVRTPFTPVDLEEASSLLLAYGGTAESVKEDLITLGELSSATGANISEVAQIFGQVQSQGRLTGERLVQLQERSIPVVELLAKTLNVAESEIASLVSAGQISFETLRKSLTDATREGGRFAGSLERQSQTLEGLRSTLSGIRDAILRAFGQRLLGSVKVITKQVITLGNAFLDFISLPVATELEKNIEAINNEQVELNSLVGAITDANTSEEERAKLIGDLNAQYPDFLGNLNAEKVTNEQLTARLKEVNEQYVIRIALAEKQDQIDKILEEAGERRSRAFNLEADARERLARIRQNAGLDGLGEGATLLDRVNSTLVELGGSLFVAENFPEQLTPLQQAVARLGDELALAGQATRDSSALTDEATKLQAIFNEVLEESGINLDSNKKSTDDLSTSTSRSTSELKAQAGSIAAIQAQISALQKLIINTAIFWTVGCTLVLNCIIKPLITAFFINPNR